MMKNSLYEQCIANGVAFRSSECYPGAVFCALPGSKVDGHSFLREAKEKGADSAVILDTYKGESYGLHCYRVKDVLSTLQALTHQVVTEYKMRIIAVTGSCGKTTTKDYTAAMLSAQYDVEKSPGTRNSQIGLPAAILNMRKDAELYVFEMGMSQAGEIRRLVEIAPPECAAITMIGRAHLEFFENIEGIARAKGELFSSPLTTRKFVGEQAARYPFLVENATVVPYRRFERLNELPGHFHDNASIALAIAEAYGVSEEVALPRVLEIQDSRRFAVQHVDGVYWLSDCYNAIPEATMAALKNLPNKGRRKGGFFSAMGELGPASEAAHLEVGSVAGKHLDYAVCYGEDMRHFQCAFSKHGKKAFWFATKEEAFTHLQTLVQQGDLILVKGANTQKLWELIPCSS